MLAICKYGEEVLKTRAKEVISIDEKIAGLVKEMQATMYGAQGIGLAAPQIGRSIQLAIVDTTLGQSQEEFMVLINPEIISREGGETLEEGCLSIPGVSAPVERSTRILVRAYDLHGNEIRQEYQGYLARVIQHEIDHLQGTLIIDRVSSLKKQLMKKEIRRLKKNDEW